MSVCTVYLWSDWQLEDIYDEGQKSAGQWKIQYPADTVQYNFTADKITAVLVQRILYFTI